MSSAVQFPSLATAAFHEAALTPAPRVAVFDCDGTLWSGDAGSGFMRWTIETGLVSRETVDGIDRQYREYLRGTVSEEAICGAMVQMYQGLRETEMRRAARMYFAEHVEERIFPAMRELVERMRALGTEIWAVSSTNDWVIEEGVQRFGIPPERVLSARVRVVDGLVTNELLEVPTDEGKVAALNRVGVQRPDTVFGNSVHDAAMLAIAERPFAVNPTAELVERAQAAGWPMYLPQGR